MSSKRDLENKRIQLEKDIRTVYAKMTENISLPSMRGLEQGRIDRGFELALSSDPLTKYQTTWEKCLCPDSGYRGIRYICKHRLAYMMRRPDKLDFLIFVDEPLFDSKENY
jgi:hypothetical protein